MMIGYLLLGTVFMILVGGGGGTYYETQRVGFCVMINLLLFLSHWNTPAILVIYSHVLRAILGSTYIVHTLPYYHKSIKREQKMIAREGGATTAGTQLKPQQQSIM
jgi:hypothetical protein